VTDPDHRPLPTGPPSARFRRTVTTIAPQESIPYVAADWTDAIVTITAGDLDLCCLLGGRRRFTTGAILVLAGLSLRELHNPGLVDAVLVALTRRPP
jgi:hypothetical protein